YLRYAIFSAIGSLGVWLLAAATPALVTTIALGWAPNDHQQATRIAVVVAILLASTVALWQREYTRVFVALHRGTPFRSSARPELWTRLEAVLDRAAPSLERRPEVYRFGAPGAYVMNAFAIPSRSHPAIALGDTLLATLTDDEIVAVFAHETAHHEQFNTKRWRRARWRSLVLIVFIAVLPVLLVTQLPLGAMAVGWCMPVIILATLGKAAGRRREAETESDLRAIALGGTAQALIGALTKLHVYSRVPRRWPHAIERAATHPSLARRIQALQEAAPAVENPQPQVATPLAAFRSRNPGEVVAFDRERAYWFEGVPAGASLELHDLRDAASSYRAIAYADLTELHVTVADGDRMIAATDHDGRSWRAPIAPADVASVQAALDRVDVKLGRRRVPVAPAGTPLIRWLALALLVLLSAGGELGLALVPILIVLVRPAISAAIAATAALTIAHLLVALRLIVWADPLRQISLLLALSVTIVLIVQTVRRVRADTSRGNVRRLTREAWMTACLLAGIAVITTASLLTLVGGRPASLLSHPAAIGAASSLFAAGGALLTIPNRWWRLGGAVTSLAALGGGTILSGDGWLINRRPPVIWNSQRLTANGAVHVAGGGLTLVTSPHGEAFAVAQYQPARRGQVSGTRYVIGRFGAATPALRTSAADKIVFADDTTLIALDSIDSDSLELRAERVDGNREVVLWRQRIPGSVGAELLIDRARGSWVVVGRDEGDSSFVVESGSLNGGKPRLLRTRPIVREAENGTDDFGEAVSRPLTAFADGGAIWTTLSEARRSGGTMAPMLLVFAGGMRWELRGTDAAGEHFLTDAEGFPSCAPEVDASGALCIEHSSTASRVWRASSARSITRIAALPPVYDLVHADGADLVAAAERFGQRAAVVDIAQHRGVRLTIPGSGAVQRGTRWTADVAARGSYLIVLSTSRDGALVTRYAIR
ncbi:MAG TPA: M48 family metalloprotease, partial [Gemmatimonadaceae bacterium]|nr:M48 family metalloprotease [Gemmatimonadaceae bacterium]